MSKSNLLFSCAGIHYCAFGLGLGDGKYMTLAKLEIYLFTRVQLVGSVCIGSGRPGYLKVMEIYSMAARTPLKPVARP